MFITIMVLLILLLSPFFLLFLFPPLWLLLTRREQSRRRRRSSSSVFFCFCCVFIPPKRRGKKQQTRLLDIYSPGLLAIHDHYDYGWRRPCGYSSYLVAVKFLFFLSPLLRSLQSAWYKPRRLQRLMICQECWKFYILSKRQSSTWFVPTEW